ncbi:hypothetical protein S40293_05226 [Stachybotrys chartarum IBT 40293]|nr:hypothetical protein S40293_05226 [Stachybotrys chartarum IBT 40293]
MDSSEQHQELSQQPSVQNSPLPPQHSPYPLINNFLSLSAALPLKTADNTPMSSPGLFSPTGSRQTGLYHPTSFSESSTPVHHSGSPYLHPLQTHKVRETNKALIDSDLTTGRKLINSYEVIEEIGRGMHGKVKLARNLDTGENVAIKIIPRFSKKRRLGKVTAMSHQDKTKKEIAILKKIRHPNVVALLEVIDDPELKKIYMVLEHAELGEVVWRKKGLPHICLYERRRIEREMRGDLPTPEEEKYEQILERRQALKELKRARMAQQYAGPHEHWSMEHGAADEASSAGRQSRISSKDDMSGMEGRSSRSASRPSSQAPSRSHSAISVLDFPDDELEWNDDMETPGPMRSNANSLNGLDKAAYGSFPQEAAFRGRSPSMADSIISHMSSVDFNFNNHDAFADDFSYVPCFTIDQARSTFRDTVLGLEYLHYQGVVHRDIKPANLLWSKDHRVKISDFGVSYFGRPIRDGEPDETVSESEAKDFDDDLELAKTVGTPAFFAPELCYTDIDQEQPKVSEQIDVWSLGVTLYCLIFARIPFLAEDEFQMFRKIATEDVYIPRRRLKPVDPATSPAAMSLYKRQNAYPFRDDNDLEYEDIDNLLYDLLRQMLIKNPEKRIRLRDIKRHPWVVQGIANPIGWLDDTDPARPSSGRKIQVDERDVSSAVVPLTFLDHVRFVVKKAVGKVINPLVERSDSKSRRRATSSVGSSCGESMFSHAPPTAYQRPERRGSLRPDDYFANAARDSSQPHDQDKSPAAGTEAEAVPYDPMATVLPPLDIPREFREGAEKSAEDLQNHVRSPLRPRGHTHIPGLWRLSQHLAHLGGPIQESHTTPTTPCYDGTDDRAVGELRQSRDAESIQDMTSRARSVDRGLFTNPDKRALPQVAVSAAMAPGNIQRPKHTRSMRSVDLAKSGHAAGSPLSNSPHSLHSAYQHGQPQSDPNIHEKDRPQIAVRQPSSQINSEPASSASPAQRVTSSESFARAREALYKKHAQDLQAAEKAGQTVNPADVPCPVSPTDEAFVGTAPPSRGETVATAQSSSTDSIGALGNSSTSPSEVTSPISGGTAAKNSADRISAFQSDPSLPALLSGASSVSADMEGELLGRPGVVSNQPDLLQTTDSLTPPAYAKEPSGGFPIDQVFGNPPAMESGPLTMHFQPYRSYTPDGQLPETRPNREDHYGGSSEEEDDEDDEDDGIFLMAKPKKKTSGVASPVSPFEAKRRDTNISMISTASTETAKKFGAHGDETAA